MELLFRSNGLQSVFGNVINQVIQCWYLKYVKKKISQHHKSTNARMEDVLYNSTGVRVQKVVEMNTRQYYSSRSRWDNNR